MSDENKSGGFMWFLAGLGVGALVGVLYAPKPGRETRDDLVSGARDGSEYLKKRSKEAAGKVGDVVDRSKAQVGEYVDRGRASLNEYVDRGKEHVDKGRAQWEEFVEKGRSFVGEQSDRVSAAVDAGKQAYRSTTAPTDPTNY